MLTLNSQLGFHVIEVKTEFQDSEHLDWSVTIKITNNTTRQPKIRVLILQNQHAAGDLGDPNTVSPSITAMLYSNSLLPI